MKAQLYKHPNENSRLTLKSQSGNIATFEKIDEPKVYKAGSDRMGYPTMICNINNVTTL